MILRNINKNEIDSVIKATTPEKSSFKDILESWINEGITRLEWCFVVEDHGNILGRLIYGVFDNSLKMLDIWMKNFNDETKEKLLSDSLKIMKVKGFNNVECHLYSDKNNFQQYVKALTSVEFKVTQEKKSFVWEEGIINSLSGDLYFSTLEQIGSNEFINAIEKVTVGTLDEDDLAWVKEFGSKEAAIKYFNLLKDIDYTEGWWKLAYNREQELLGLVVPQRLTEGIGGINYIGVIPEKRGQGYINHLVIEGVKTLKDNNIKKVIADIDVKNYPLYKVLQKQGFKLDCTMLVLKLDL
ncbi:GNAT family N-acetyltransferase [Clostridium sp. UBA4548]|uniref:GNAT family N-acetyltransferase n=1 Tax=Clostridium sp. UBA4548 TaxID=1946361 RepID=UPI0025C369A8|nr:GNAT family N-acetyltransferase [Clostridium sp. UBA4548]